MRQVLRTLFTASNRFAKKEDGVVSAEFAVIAPAILLILFTSFEIGLLTIRETSLERSLDIVVRDIRLSTGSAPQHDAIKTQICDNAPLISGCEDGLRLEMVQIDPRNWATPLGDADCIDAAATVSPVRAFENGQENELMVLRACLMVDPLIPWAGLGKTLTEDNGRTQYGLVAKAAFVQEPR